MSGSVVQLPADMLGQMLKRLEENAVGNKSVEVLGESIRELGVKIDGLSTGQATISATLEITSARHAAEISALFEKSKSLGERVGKFESRVAFAMGAAVIVGGILQFILSRFIEGRQS